MPKLGRKEGEAPGQARRIALFPFIGQTSTRLSRFWRQDGAWLDQNGYGTCVAFAEGHRIADQPTYHPDLGINDEWAFKLYRDATGDDSMQEGTWANVVAEELLRRGTISRFEWITSPEDLKFAVLEKGPVAIGIPWYESMFNPYPAHNNFYLDCDPASGLAGGHEVLLNAVHTAPAEGPPYYRVKNSWGKWWGKGGTARMTIEDVNRLVFEEWGDALWMREAA